jgi:hypothetical protein
MNVFSALSNELTPVSNTPNNISVIGELCLKPPVNVVRIRVFVKEKSNGRVLLAVHPAMKNLNVQRNSYCQGWLLSPGEGSVAQRWCSEDTQYWLFINV